jgi:hypothetical protein
MLEPRRASVARNVIWVMYRLSMVDYKSMYILMINKIRFELRRVKNRKKGITNSPVGKRGSVGQSRDTEREGG